MFSSHFMLSCLQDSHSILQTQCSETLHAAFRLPALGLEQAHQQLMLLATVIFSAGWSDIPQDTVVNFLMSG